LGHQVAQVIDIKIVKIDIQIGAMQFAPIWSWGNFESGAQQKYINILAIEVFCGLD